MKTGIFSLWIVSVFLMTCLCSDALAYQLGGRSWPNAEAVIYSQGGNSTATFDTAMIEAMNNWNNYSNFVYISIDRFIDPCANPNSYGPPWFSGYAFSNDDCGTAFGRSTLAVNLQWSIGSDIIQTGTVFNTAMSWDVYHGSGSNYDFRRVAIHELGHALGLEHEASVPSIMQPIYSTTLETPQADDINGLRAIYNVGVVAFVARFYRQCLAREPEPEGLDNWVASLSNGSRCGGDVANGFIFSQEFIDRNTSNEEFVTILYRAFLEREPDTAGYNGWVNYLYSGASRQEVLNGFVFSQEFENISTSYGIAPYCA